MLFGNHSDSSSSDDDEFCPGSSSIPPLSRVLPASVSIANRTNLR